MLGRKRLDFTGAFAAGNVTTATFPAGVSGRVPMLMIRLRLTFANANAAPLTPSLVDWLLKCLVTCNYKNQNDQAAFAFSTSLPAVDLILDYAIKTLIDWIVGTAPAVPAAVMGVPGTASMDLVLPLQFAYLLSDTCDGEVDLRELKDLSLQLPGAPNLGSVDLSITSMSGHVTYMPQPGGVLAPRRGIRQNSETDSAISTAEGGCKVEYVALVTDAGDDAVQITSVKEDNVEISSRDTIGDSIDLPFVLAQGASPSIGDLTHVARHGLVYGVKTGTYSHRQAARRVDIVLQAKLATSPRKVFGVVENSDLQGTNRATGAELEEAADRVIAKGVPVDPVTRKTAIPLPDDTVRFMPRYRRG